MLNNVYLTHGNKLNPEVLETPGGYGRLDD